MNGQLVALQVGVMKWCRPGMTIAGPWFCRVCIILPWTIMLSRMKVFHCYKCIVWWVCGLPEYGYAIGSFCSSPEWWFCRVTVLQVCFNCYRSCKVMFAHVCLVLCHVLTWFCIRYKVVWFGLFCIRFYGSALLLTWTLIANL